MEVGTEAVGVSSLPSAVRPAQGGRGSSQLSRRLDDGLLADTTDGGALYSSGGPSVPRSLDRSSSLLNTKPDLVTKSGQQQDLIQDLDSIAPEAMVEEVIIRDAFKEENAIVIKWDSDTLNILGFRVIYRLFGTPQFKQGPPLAPSEREFKIKNVPDSVSLSISRAGQRDNNAATM